MLTKNEIFKLREQYSHLMSEGLEFCFKYLNFYIGLLSVLTVASITAVLQFNGRRPFGLLLLIGPALVVSLAVLGYKTVRVFYRRFVEAWITSLNVDGDAGLARRSKTGN